jgi:hypothetical protein
VPTVPNAYSSEKDPYELIALHQLLDDSCNAVRDYNQDAFLQGTASFGAPPFHPVSPAPAALRGITDEKRTSIVSCYFITSSKAFIHNNIVIVYCQMFCIAAFITKVLNIRKKTADVPI